MKAPPQRLPNPPKIPSLGGVLLAVNGFFECGGVSWTLFELLSSQVRRRSAKKGRG